MSSGLHGRDHASNDKYMFRSIWQPLVRAVDDYLRLVREIAHKPDEPNVANQPAEPSQPHRCERHNERNCNCAGGTCADDDGGASDGNPFEQHRQQYRDRIRAPEPNHLGNFRCPISGQLCSSSVCREWCEGSGSGTTAGADRRIAKAADYYRNIDSETGDA